MGKFLHIIRLRRFFNLTIIEQQIYKTYTHYYELTIHIMSIIDYLSQNTNANFVGRIPNNM